MAIIGVNIGSSDQTIDESNYDAGDTLSITALGTNTLTIDGVSTSANFAAGVSIVGNPTYNLVNGGDLTINFGVANLSALSGTTYNVGDGSALTINGPTVDVGLINNQTINFTGDGGGVFSYDPSGLIGTGQTFNVESLGVGDTLSVGDRTNGTFTYNAETQTGTLNYPGGILGVGGGPVTFNVQNLSQEDYDAIIADHGGTTGFGEFVSPVCFLRGTMIQTTKGEVAIEDLVAGDVVIGQSGERTVKWVGFRKTYTKRIPADRRAEHMPIRIVRDAIAENVPSKDIVVSPGHHILVEGKLVRAQDMVNGKTIYQETHHVSYEYFHVELDQFDVISAHGLMSESWADGGNRDYFQNADVAALRPEDRKRRRADRPGFVALRKGAELERLQAVYAARAEKLQQEQDQELMVAYG
ncbi:Hedgehog/Intein (Hint) domain-containing protein [Bordetella tumbae]|uniref:Hint domain-containing protein n=1 Tax=Bordetella tumbae TaxID=1649139 RepID=UPI0039F14750